MTDQASSIDSGAAQARNDAIIQAQAAAGADIAAVATPQGATLVVRPPEGEKSVVYNVRPGDVVELVGEAFAKGEYAIVEGGLLITLPEGGVVFLSDFELAASGEPPLIVQANDGPALFASDLVANLDLTRPQEAAAGPPDAGPSDDGGGAGFSTADLGGAPSLLDPTGPLRPTSLAFDAPEPALEQLGALGREGASTPGEPGQPSEPGQPGEPSAPANRPPVATDDQGVHVDEDSGPTILNPAGFLADDYDPDGDPISLVSVQNGRGGSVALTEDGDIRFTPDKDFSGDATFEYTITDGRGGFDTATVTVKVNAINDGPVATDDEGVTVGKGETIVLDPKGFLADDFDADGDALTLVRVDKAVEGKVYLNEDGKIVFEAADDPSGKASFEYTITDGNGGFDTATVTINFRPHATDDANVTVLEDRPVLLDPKGFLEDDKDPDGDPISLFSVQNAVNGSVTLVDGKIQFTPAKDYFGPASFEYTISDGNGGFDTATVQIDVVSVNDAPVATDDRGVYTNEDTAVYLDPTGFLADDYDPEGGALTLVSVGGGVNGTAELLADGRIKFTPAKDFDGEASFDYTIADPEGATATATVAVAVLPVNDAPVASDDEGVTVRAGETVTLDPAGFTADDKDVDGDALSIVAVVNAVNGSVALIDGKIQFTGADAPTGRGSFDYVVSDGNGGFDTATVRVNFAPTATDDQNVSVRGRKIITLDPAGFLEDDSDVEGDGLSFVGVENPENGNVWLEGGMVRFQADPGFVGEASFDYRITDGMGGFDTATVTVEVLYNEAPDATDDFNVTTRGTKELVLDPAGFLEDDTDAEGDEISLVAVSNPIGGQVAIDSDGQIRFQADPDFAGEARFDYTITDGRGGYDSATVFVDVLPNHKPVATDDANVRIAEDAGWVGLDPAGFLEDDADADGDALTLIGVSNAKNGEVLLEDGQILFKPDDNFHGQASFDYTIADGHGGQATATVAVEVLSVNDVPVATDDGNVSTQEDRAVSIDPAGLLADDYDADGDTLELAAVQKPVGGTVVLEGGRIVFTPEKDFNGEASFEYVVHDGNGGWDAGRVTVQVEAVNDAPVATDDAGISTAEDTPITIEKEGLIGDDLDVDGDALTITRVFDAIGGEVSLDANGDVYFKPFEDFNGDASFAYEVSDGKGGTDTAEVALEVRPVNDAPVATDDQGISTDEDRPIRIEIAKIIGDDRDVDGDALTLRSVQNAQNGDVRIDGDFVLFTPDRDFNGEASFDYTIDDGNGGVDSASVRVDVRPVNDAPVAENDVVAPGRPGQTLEIDPATLLSNDSDIEGDDLIITSVFDAAGGSVSMQDGKIFFAVPEGARAEGTFSYTVTDGKGLFAVGQARVNLVPVATDDHNVRTAEDTPVTLDPAGFLEDDYDLDGDAIELAAVQNAVNGKVALVDGEIVFTPDPNFHGEASFEYVIHDGEGGWDAGRVTVEVLSVNDVPVATDDRNVRTTEDRAVSIDPAGLLADDTDADGDTLELAAVQNPVGGTVALKDGKILFTPEKNFNGEASFDYVVEDGQGGSDVATVTVQVDAVNDAPVATDDQGISTAEDTPITIKKDGLIGDDRDVDGDALTLTRVFDAQGGTVAIDANGDVLFTPDANFNGAATFAYEIADGQGGSDTATVTVDVRPVNDAPVASDDEGISTAEDTPIRILIADLVGDDRDVDGDALTLRSAQDAQNGSVRIDGDAILFTPAKDFAGRASFEYTIDDGKGGVDSAQVRVDVRAVNDAPVAEADLVNAGVAGKTLAIDVADLLDNDRDADGDRLEITGVFGAVGGSVSMKDGKIYFTVAEGAAAEPTFSYSVTDGSGLFALGQARVNLAPIASDDFNVATDEDTPVTIDPSGFVADDRDPDGDALSLVGVGGAKNGSVELVDGKVVFTPEPNFHGQASFEYTIRDADGAEDRATVLVDVRSVNDAPVASNDGNVATEEDRAVTIQPHGLTADDVDADGDPLTITAVRNAVHGSVALVGGEIVFTPEPNYHGPASFDYVVADGRGGEDSATVQVDVLAVNDIPVASDDGGISTPEDTPITLEAAHLIGDDRDDDGDPLAITEVARGEGGEVSLTEDGDVLFSPDADFNGIATFEYTIGDGQGGFDSAIVSVDVRPVNDAPEASDDSGVATRINRAVSLDPKGFVADDVDADGDPLELVDVLNPQHGDVALQDGKILFTPDEDFTGEASFDYVIEDPSGAKSVATVTISVNPLDVSSLVAGADESTSAS